MHEKKWLAEKFEADRSRLRAVAYRMLGSTAEADDAVQETWLRLARAEAETLENVGGWLTTVIARVCLDMLRQRKARREDVLDAGVPEPVAGDEASPEHERLLADTVGLALLVVLDTLTPAERVAFVLHDMFDLPFDDIAPIIDRSPAAARQLASRARRRVQGKTPASDADVARQRQVVDAFLAAAHGNDFEALLRLLDPEVVFRADAVAVRMGSEAEIRGAPAVANTFKGRAQGAKPALVEGELALAVIFGGQLRIALRLEITNGKIAAIEAIADPQRLETFELELLDG